MRSGAGAHTRTGLILTVACIAQFMVVLDVSVVNVALPTIQGSLHYSPSGLQWVVNAYVLTFAGFLLLGGRAADVFGQKKIFLLGLVIFTGASLAGGLATDSTWLTTARAVQGFGGAILSPATLTIIVTTFSGPKLARSIGMWSSVAGAGGATGALLGGILVTELSWRWVLFVNVPIGAVLAFMAVTWLPEHRRTADARTIDYTGAILVTAGLSVAVYGIVNTTSYAWGSARTIVTLAIGVALLLAFFIVETRVVEVPLLPMRFFRSRAASGANVVMLLIGAAFFSMWYFLTLFMQFVLGYSALKTGLAFLPQSVAIIIGAQTASRLVSKVGPRRIIGCGTVFAAIGMWWLSRLPATGNYYAHVLPPMMLVSLGLGLCIVPVTVAATMGVDRKEAGLASGLVNTTRQVGGALGLAALATIATDRSRGLRTAVALSSGFDRAFLAGGFIAVVGGLLALTLPGRNAHVAAVEQSARDHSAPPQPAVAEH